MVALRRPDAPLYRSARREDPVRWDDSGVAGCGELVFVELIGRINPIKSRPDSIRIQSRRRRPR